MIPFIVFDVPTFSAFAAAAILVATVYLIYRDIRLIMQMVNDLREEFMVLHLTSKQSDHSADGDETETEIQDNGDIREDTFTKSDGESDGEDLEHDGLLSEEPKHETDVVET